MRGRVRFHSVGAVVLLLAVGACALPTERIASPDHLATPLPRLAVADRPPADVAAHVASQDHVATSPPRLAAVHTPPVEMRELDSYAAVGNDATGSIAPAARTPDVPAPFRRVQKHVYLLLGGLQGKDGWVTSAGMFGLRSSLTALPDVTVTTYDWPSYKKVAADIASLPKDDVVIVIGYSGGGARATWLANLPSKPHIDLMIAMIRARLGGCRSSARTSNGHSATATSHPRFSAYPRLAS